MSSKASRSVQTLRATHRAGEGVLIDVEVKHVVSPSGSSFSAMSFELGNTPVPERSYGSEVFSIQYSRGMVTIYFGQTKASNPAALQSLLAVRMSPSSVRTFIASLTDKIQGIDRSIEESLLQPGLAADEPFEITEDPDQMVKLTANFAVTAVSNADACVDFLNASPFALLALSHAPKLAIQPVVRVELPAQQLLGLLFALRMTENSFPEDPKAQQ